MCRMTWVAMRGRPCLVDVQYGEVGRQADDQGLTLTLHSSTLQLNLSRF
jgi:hypothetical protein